MLLPFPCKFNYLTTKKCTNGLQKKEKEPKEKSGSTTKATVKQKLKNLNKRGSPKKKNEILKQRGRSTHAKVSKQRKKNSTPGVKKSGRTQVTTAGIAQTPRKKIRLADQEIFENSKFEILNYHSTGISASATHTPTEMTLVKTVADVNLKLPDGTDEIKLKNKTDKEDEDDTLFNVDPIMPDIDLPSLRLNAKTE